jgi:acyl carrier protein
MGIIISDFCTVISNGRKYVKTEIIKKLRELIVDARGIPYDRVTLDVELSDLDVDSLGIIDVMTAIEEEFGLNDLDEKVYLKFTTVRALVDYIYESLKNNLPPSN